MGAQGRKTQLQVLHEISVSVGPNSPASGVVGIYPAGAQPVAIHLQVSTGFNSTTNTIQIGTTPGGVNFLGATSIQAVSRADFASPGGIIPSGDSTLYYTLVSTGPAPTLGAATFWLEYVPAAG